MADRNKNTWTHYILEHLLKKRIRKVYMAREGAFENVDIMFHWHPLHPTRQVPVPLMPTNQVSLLLKAYQLMLQTLDKGRSALDGVEAMNMMVNMMREHIPQESRIHYAITKED